MKENIIYGVKIKEIAFRVSNNFSPYIDIITETMDDNNLTINASYYFTNKSKYISYVQLSELLGQYGMKIEPIKSDIIKDLDSLIGKEVYLQKDPNYKDKYIIFKDYKEKAFESEAV
jgi:hypothetical protein